MSRLKSSDFDSWEHVRRLRDGDFKRLFRHRYYRPGHYQLPDDSAGRDDLWLYVVNTSMAACAPKEKMHHVIETWAPWMSAEERDSFVELVWGLDFYARHISARELGRRLGVTNAERERLKLWQFLPIDMTDEQLAEHRRRKNNERRRAKRRSRAEYLASCNGKPWEVEGISRSTWYRKRETSPDATILGKLSPYLSHLREAESQYGLQGGESKGESVQSKERVESSGEA